MNQYYLSDVPERNLMAQHFHSSLDQPNLDNVEAKLYVARQKNHELAMQYFKNKYGSTALYQEFAKTHNLGQINTLQSKEQQLRRHLDRKALEIANKYKENPNYAKYRQEVEEDQINKPFLRGTKNNKKASNNPWTTKQQTQGSNNVKSEEKVIDSVDNYKNKKDSEFINQFRNYLANKSNLDKSQIISNSKLGKTFQSNVSVVTNKQTKVEPKQKKVKRYEEELARKIFRDICQSPFNDKTTIQKVSLIEYLVQNEKILKVLGLTEETLNQKLMGDEQTQYDSHISFQEFLFFILRTVGKEKEIKQIQQDKRDRTIPQGCMLSQQTINRFEELFKKLDRHTDLIVKRMVYTEMLAKDPFIKKQLNNPAVYEELLDKRVTLRRIFERIEIQVLFGGEEEKKIKEYISWNQFLFFFKSNSIDRSRYNLMNLMDTIKKEDKFGLVQVPEVVMDIILHSCNHVKREYEEFFNTNDVIQAIFRNKEYQHEKYTPVRLQSRISNLPSQTFDEVLSRIKQTAPKYLTIKQLLQYFSTRGKPVEVFEESKQQEMKKNFSGVKVKFAEKGLMQEHHALDGYDSDPQMYNNSQLVKNSPKKSGRSSKKLSKTKSFTEQGRQSKVVTKQPKITVPQPFSFDERDRNKSKAKSFIQQSIIQQEEYQPFKAKEIPSSVKDTGLYERKLEEDRKRIQERKKNSMIITLASEKPFSFLNRKTNKKTKEDRKEYAFKANPIPWYCSVQLLEKKKEAEILRNQKIAKEAQQSLAKAKLPPRMEKDFQQELAKKVMKKEQAKSQSVQKPFVYREPPNFEKLHQKFEEQIERKRKQNKTTKPQEFNFSQRPHSRPKTAENNGLNTFTQSFIKNLADTNGYKKNLEGKEAAATTLKFQQQAEKRRLQMQSKMKKEEKLKQEDEDRKKIDEQLRQKVIDLAKNKENKQKQERQKRQDEMKQQNKKFKEWKKQRVEKGRQQPMLVQRPLKRDEKIQRMRKLQQISETLKSNGIKGKDHDSYFKKEQLLLLQDWQLLKNKLS